jgi:peptidoglycan/xylan/chitin deacetylase (PgdA/CDA1 family)
MQTQKPGEKPRPFVKKAVRFVGFLVSMGILAWAVYGSYLYADYLQLTQKSAELPGLRLYSVQESHATRAYSWYASYPKIDEPGFDRAISKLVNDAKAAFLARVNFQAKTEYPRDDLNISFKLGKYNDGHLSVTVTKHQTLRGENADSSTLVTYDRKAKRIESMRPAEVPKDEMKTFESFKTAPAKEDCKKAKCVALTFDDGPNYVTPRILDALKVYKAKATFFEVGAQARLYPSVARRTVREGHAVGTMGENHRNLLAAPLADAKSDLSAGSEAVRAAAGVRPQLARAAYGAVTDGLAKKLSAPFVGWNVASSDDASSAKIYDTVMTKVHSGAIVMSPDTKEATADAYTRIIPELLRRGYKLVTVPQLLGSDSLKPGVQDGR